MDFARILSFVDAYILWIYAAGLLAALISLREIGQARKRGKETIFSLEREFAAIREGRARTTLVIALALLASLTYLKLAILPDQPLPPLRQPTPTRVTITVPTNTPVTATPTRTRIPTRSRPTRQPPTETPTSTVAPPPCPNPSGCITFPAASQVITEPLTIWGTASIEAFQFYKIEYGLGETPEQWHSIGDVHTAPVVDGVLSTWDPAGFPNGILKLRLTVVDITGNYPPPHEIRLTIQQ